MDRRVATRLGALGPSKMVGEHVVRLAAWAVRTIARYALVGTDTGAPTPVHAVSIHSSNSSSVVVDRAGSHERLDMAYIESVGGKRWMELGGIAYLGSSEKGNSSRLGSN